MLLEYRIVHGKRAKYEVSKTRCFFFFSMMLLKNFVTTFAVTFALLNCAFPDAHAQAEASPEESATTEATWMDSLSSSHEGLRTDLFALADRADDFFGNERSIEKKQDDYFRNGVEMRVRTGSHVRFRHRLRLGIDLSGISDRLKLVAEGTQSDATDSEATALDDSDDREIIDDQREDAARTALRYQLLRESQIDLDVDGGLKTTSGGVNPYSRVRASRFFKLNELWSVEPAQFLLWELDDGFGERTRFDLNRKLGEHSFARLRSELLYSESSRGGENFHELAAYREVNDRAYFGALVSMAGYMEPGFAVDEARVAVKYRQNLKWPWLLVEVEPALAFPDDREHRITPEIIFRLDVYFDRAHPGQSLIKGIGETFRRKSAVR